MGLLYTAAGILSALGMLLAALFVTRKELTRIIAAQDKKFLDVLAEQRKVFQEAVVAHRTEMHAGVDALREEMRTLNEQQSAERLRLHGENRETNKEIFDRVKDLEKGVSRIDGSLSGRFRTLDPR
jgi:dihydroorotase